MRSLVRCFTERKNALENARLRTMLCEFSSMGESKWGAARHDGETLDEMLDGANRRMYELKNSSLTREVLS